MAIAIDGGIERRHRNFEHIGEVQKFGVGDFVQLAFDLGETFPAYIPTFELNSDR